MINKAELGDFLYIIIFVVVMIVGIFEKIAKSKRQQQQPATPPPMPYDDFENVEQSTAPQTLEDIMRRMMQPMETRDNTEEAQSLEDIADSHFHYQPLECPETSQAEQEAFVEEEIITGEHREFVFDIRQAVIASEILNRRY